MNVLDVHFLRYVVSYFLKILLKAHSHAYLFPKNGIKFAKKLIAFCSYYIKYDTVKIVSEYDQEILQSQTADNPVAPRGRAAQS